MFLVIGLAEKKGKMEFKKKSCKTVIRIHKGVKIRCGFTNRVGDKKIKEYCSMCSAYNNGYKNGYAKKIRAKRRCQVLTCNKEASRIICTGQHLINVCPSHSKGHEWKEIKEETDVR